MTEPSDASNGSATPDTSKGERLGSGLLGQVAGNLIAGLELTQQRLLDAAAVHRERAAGVEPTAGRRVDRAGDLAGQDDPLARPLDLGIGYRHRREQRPGVRVERQAVQCVALADLDDLAEVH